MQAKGGLVWLIRWSVAAQCRLPQVHLDAAVGICHRDHVVDRDNLHHLSTINCLLSVCLRFKVGTTRDISEIREVNSDLDRSRSTTFAQVLL